jgi:hypothetical protein
VHRVQNVKGGGECGFRFADWMGRSNMYHMIARTLRVPVIRFKKESA